MLFSIIVPVYNVKEFLPRCVTSVDKWNTKYEYEVILVDDGSTDGSSTLCDLLKDKYSNIEVIHKPNGGLSDARNIGLLNAKGEFVIFLDSDDYLADDALETIGSKIEVQFPDILFAEVIVETNGKQIGVYRKIGLKERTTYDGCTAMISELQNGKFQAMSVIGIYRRAFILDNNLLFKKGILHEDEEWTPRVMANAKKVEYIEFPFYVYDIREGSITQRKDKTKNSSDLIDTCIDLDNYFKVHPNVLLRKLYRGYLARLYMAAVSECMVRGNINRIQDKITRGFVWGKWTSMKDFIKILVFCCSPKVYSMLLERARSKMDKPNSVMTIKTL